MIGGKNDELPTIEELTKDFLEKNSAKPSPIIEVDEEGSETPIPSLSLPSASQLNHLTPSRTTNRTRHDSSCSSNNSIKYTQ